MDIKTINYMLNGKGRVVILVVLLIKNAQYEWVNIFWIRNPESKVELDLSNYVSKADLENATGVNTSKFA